MSAKALIFLFFAVFYCSAQEIINKPRNTTVKLGQNARINCTVDGDVSANPLSWKEMISNPLGTIIYKSDMEGPNDPEDYDIQGSYDLIIKDTELMDAGVYTCQLTTMDNPLLAQLLVIGEPIIIEQPMELHEGVEVSFGCAVDYGAPKLYMMESQLPVFRASIKNRVIEVDEDGLQRKIGEPGKESSHMSGQYTFEALPEYDQELFNCTVLTEDPEFSYTISHRLNIRYVTNSINIINKASSYLIGEKLVCEANGNPQPRYQWVPMLNQDKVKAIEGKELLLTKLMIGSNEWHCQALDEEGEIIVKDDHSFKVEDGELSGAGRPVVQFMLLVALSWIIY